MSRIEPAFHTTRWSVVVRAREGAPEEARGALEELCRAAWYPLYAYVRRRGHAPEAAEDLVQGFFAQFLAAGHVERADPARGRFRGYLLGALKHHLSHEKERAAAEKRGGGLRVVAIDRDEGESRLSAEPAHEQTPERAFERDWCVALLERVRQRLEAHYAETCRGALYAALAPAVRGGGEGVEYAAVARELDMSEVAVRVAVHRLRQRYGALLREEVAQTLEEGAEVDSELELLLAALS